MDREKEIWKMVEIAREYSKDIANTPYYLGVVTDMTALYEAGYRRADEVRKETIREIWERISNVEGAATESAISYSMKVVAEFERILAEYGVEVD